MKILLIAFIVCTAAKFNREEENRARNAEIELIKRIDGNREFDDFAGLTSEQKSTICSLMVKSFKKMTLSLQQLPIKEKGVEEKILEFYHENKGKVVTVPHTLKCLVQLFNTYVWLIADKEGCFYLCNNVNLEGRKGIAEANIFASARYCPNEQELGFSLSVYSSGVEEAGTSYNYSNSPLLGNNERKKKSKKLWSRFLKKF